MPPRRRHVLLQFSKLGGDDFQIDVDWSMGRLFFGVIPCDDERLE